MDSKTFYEYLLKRGFKRRESQERMIELVEEVIEEGGVKLIEAPTGTGKTFAYLIPLITSGQKAIISTGTKILQDQLKRDLEFLRGHYKILTGKNVSYAVLKGKGNYLCLDRYHKEGKELDLGNIPEFMEKEWDGDLTQTNVSQEVISKINVDEDYCTRAYREVCPYRHECYYWSIAKARENSVQILIVNHALLALKEFEETRDKVLVIDEAHELDRYLTLATTWGISLYFIRQIIEKLSKLLQKEINLEPEKFFIENFENLFKEKNSEEITVDSLAPYMPDFRLRVFEPLKNYLNEARERVKEFVKDFVSERLMISYRLKSFMERSMLFDHEFLSSVNASYDEESSEEKVVIEKLRDYLFVDRKITKMSNFVRICEEDDLETGYRLERKWSKKLNTFNYRMEVFPVFPRNVINQEEYKGVILTSATVDPEDIDFTTGIRGEYYRLKKNFDYSKVVFIVKNTNPKLKNWKDELLYAFESLLSMYDKVLVLLTNKEHLKFFENYPGVAIQGQDSLNVLLEKLRRGKIRALVGLDSLWTGVDVRGDKGILMSKLPFEHPEDPVTYHRVRFLKAMGLDHFEYMRRKAFIKFRQGVGRLVRQEGDKGTIVICDNRIYRYPEFIEYLRELGIKVINEGKFFPTFRRTWGYPY